MLDMRALKTMARQSNRRQTSDHDWFPSPFFFVRLLHNSASTSRRCDPFGNPLEDQYLARSNSSKSRKEDISEIDFFLSIIEFIALLFQNL